MGEPQLEEGSWESHQEGILFPLTLGQCPSALGEAASHMHNQHGLLQYSKVEVQGCIWVTQIIRKGEGLRNGISYL